jgi:hypothetical protein
MSQNTAGHYTHRNAEDEDEEVAPQARQPEHKPGVRARRPADQPPGDGGVGPDGPDEGEFQLIGDNDLGAADLGPAAPGASDPDVDSEPIRKIAR